MTRQEQLEEELRRALRREDAPPDLARNVLARAKAAPVRASTWDRIVGAAQLPVVRFATAAVLIVAAVGGSMEYRHYEREKRAGEEAKQQLMLALRITGSKLQYVEAKVNQRGSQQFGPEHERGEESQ